MLTGNVDRRAALKVAGAAGLLGWLGGGTRGASARTVRPSAGGMAARSVRFAHLTDIHVQPELKADQGLAACLKHLMALQDRPQLVVTGGDLVFDSFGQGHDRTKALWDMLGNGFKDGCGVPVLHTIGNHDIWGWNKTKSKTTGGETGWGKKWFCEMVQRDTSYHASDHGRWRVIQLDSIQPDPENPDGYIGMLDEAQMAWLEGQIKGAPEGTSIAIVSHIPIMTVTHLVEVKQVKEWDYEIDGGVMHLDAARLHKLFAASGKVKLCLSGHIHRNDRVEMDGVTYICDGAVRGGKAAATGAMRGTA
jgi:3',5'-cyclic AMP phosphodiesterase CpdA